MKDFEQVLEYTPWSGESTRTGERGRGGEEEKRRRGEGEKTSG